MFFLLVGCEELCEPNLKRRAERRLAGDGGTCQNWQISNYERLIKWSLKDRATLTGVGNPA